MIPQPESVIARTKSVCPVCLTRIEAYYVHRYDGVWFVKDCPEHGHFESFVAGDAARFRVWRHPQEAQPPEMTDMRVERGCPYDCGLCADHEQESCCVLLEVTKRCNLRCPVCFARGGETEAADPPLTRIAAWYEMLRKRQKPFNIQLSGGEPTLRDDLADIIRLGREMGFHFFQLNTNGIRIARQPDYLHALVLAGLSTVFLQFDSLLPETLVRLRGADILKEKQQAIENCRLEGVGVVLVPTLMRGVNEGETGAILEYAAAHMPIVRGVHFQPMSYFGRYKEAPGARDHIGLFELMDLIETQMNGRLQVSDFAPGGAEHALCSFHADYEISGDKWRRISKPGAFCCTGQSAKGGGCCAFVTDSSCCKEHDTQGSSMAAGADAIDISGQDAAGKQEKRRSSDIARRAVAAKWSAHTIRTGAEADAATGAKTGTKVDVTTSAKTGTGLSSLVNVDALDEFLVRRATQTLAVSAMAFQDAWTLDLARLKRCHIHIVSEDGRLIPFCACNLSAADGRALYR